MLQSSQPFASFAVPDIGAARHFYGEQLGLDVRDAPEQGIIELHFNGGPPVIVYPKPDHRPAVFTILNFPVADVDAAVDELAGKGIGMERFEMDGMEPDDKGIYRGEGPAIAWFKDPAGNILSVLETS